MNLWTDSMRYVLFLLPIITIPIPVSYTHLLMPKKNDFKLDVVSVRLVKDAPIYSEHTFNNPADVYKRQHLPGDGLFQKKP